MQAQVTCPNCEASHTVTAACFVGCPCGVSLEVDYKQFPNGNAVAVVYETHYPAPEPVVIKKPRSLFDD